MTDQPVSLQPERVLSAYQARTRQHLAGQSEAVANLLYEIAQLEAFVAQLMAELDQYRSTSPNQ